jgi:PAS domain S-box-containing protein
MGTDMKGNIIIWNQGAEETLGYQASETIGGMNVRNLYPDDMARQVMQMMRSDRLRRHGQAAFLSHDLQGQGRRSVEGNLSASIIYDEAGREKASVGIFVDLEEQLKMERKLHKTQEQLLQSEKLAAMGRLTSQIAHELNNPLYGIMNTLELMKTEIPTGNKRRKLLEMSLSETVRVTDMLRKMLSFSKPDQEERAPVDINTILDEILLLHEKQLWEHSIKMVHSFADHLGKVHASKNQLRQVFLNLISNARDAMPEGGRLTVTTEGDDYFVHITISDNGVGIKEEHLDLVFETFFTTKTDSVKGVGLGLSVCYGFIKDHGGDIKVDSRVGEGTTFSISLPVTAGRTCAFDALDIDVTLVILDGGPDNRHAQSGPAASHDLLRVKGFEDPLEVIRGNADTPVFNAQDRIVAFFNFLVTFNKPVHITVFGGDDDFPAPGLCLGRIRHQVHDGLPEMNRRAGHVEQIALQPGLYAYRRVIRNQFFKFGGGKILGHQPVEIQHIEADDPTTGKRQQILDNLRRPLPGSLNGQHRISQRAVVRQVQQQQFRIAHDAG